MATRICTLTIRAWRRSGDTSESSRRCDGHLALVQQPGIAQIDAMDAVAKAPRSQHQFGAGTAAAQGTTDHAIALSLVHQALKFTQAH